VARQFFTRLSATVLFWAEAFTRPGQIGAVAPSSRKLGIAMARWLPEDRQAWVIELGAGTGSVTRELLRRGHQPARLLAIEKSEKLADRLRKDYPQARIVTGDAFDLDTLLAGCGGSPGQAAAVISSLPLVNFAPASANRLVQKIHAVLVSGGLYVQFTYRLLRQPPAAVSQFARAGSQIVWANLPPARVNAYRKA